MITKIGQRALILDDGIPFREGIVKQRYEKISFNMVLVESEKGEKRWVGERWCMEDKKAFLRDFERKAENAKKFNGKTPVFTYMQVRLAALRAFESGLKVGAKK